MVEGSSASVGRTRRSASLILNAAGIRLTDGIVDRIAASSSFEAPCVVQGSSSSGAKLSVGAYSGVFGATIWGGKIGRFCSIAKDVHIGLSEHPTDWFTSSMIGYVPDVHGWMTHRAEAGLASRLELSPFRSRAPVDVGNDVWIGYGAFVRSGVTIGNGAIVAAGSIVLQDVPPYTIVGGNPARIIRPRFDDTVVERLQKSHWWEWDVLSLPLKLAEVENSLSTIEDAILSGALQPLRPRRLTLADALAEPA